MRIITAAIFLASMVPARPYRKALAQSYHPVMKRSADGTHRWCITVYPTHAMAQDADMSLADYREFVYGAGMLNEADPVAFWKEEGRKQTELATWLKGHDQAVLKGSNVDITLSIKDRRFEISDGSYNFPDGEIFTSPVEDSVNGWIRFKVSRHVRWSGSDRYRAVVRKWQVVKEKAGEKPGTAHFPAEHRCGCTHAGRMGHRHELWHPALQQEHALRRKDRRHHPFCRGAGFPECGGRNKSGLHWDMLCDMAQLRDHRRWRPILQGWKNRCMSSSALRKYSSMKV